MKRLGLGLAVGLAWAAALGAQSPAAAPAPACASAQAQVAPGARILGDWRASAPLPLPGSKPAVLTVGTDLGIASPDTRLDRMLLLLRPAPSQKQALDKTLSALQTSGSCQYHQWMTAQQFADAYANSASDVNAVADWLRGVGFTVAPIPAGRGWIEFSGTAAQVEQAFGAPVRQIATSTGTRYVLRDAITAPAVLAPLIEGLVSLDGSLSTPALTAPESASADSTGTAGTPDAVEAILGLNSIENADGTGEQIAIPTRSDIATQDVAAFRTTAGLAAKPLNVLPAGADPGKTADQAAATAMASWAGAAAPGAQVLAVPASTTAATDGIDLSLAEAVDKNLAATLVVGYSACEPELSAAHQAFYAALYRQAAAEGISVIAATGDSGASACHAAGSDAAVVHGFAVNALASTSWNTAVGASAADGSGRLQAWSSSSGYASGGGVSAAHLLPGWQPAVPGTAPGRLLPDLSLPTAADASADQGLMFCMGGQSCTTMRGGGSALAAAILGGVSARLNQKYGEQGNLAPRLYALRSDAGVFNDVQTGTARLSCVVGSPGCNSSGTIGYDAANGYDLATGLGSVHADKLVSDWARPDATGTGAVTVNVTVSPTAANSTYNPTAQITLTATVTSQTGGGTPTGTVQFVDQASNANLGSGPVTLGTNGTASLTVTGPFPNGGNNIVAQYSGDTNYAALTSPAVTINIQPSTTSVTVSTSVTAPTVGQSFTATATLAVGTPAAGSVAPSGKMTLSVDGVASSTQNVATANGTTSANFTLTMTTGGVHALQATYAGDGNYVTSTSAPAQVTVTKGATTTTLTAAPATLTAGTPETFTATVAPLNPTTTTANLTGTVTFYDGTTLLGTGTLAANVATLGNITLSTTAAHQITAVYSGDNNWATSTSTPVALTAVLLSATVALTAAPANPAPGQLVTLTATVTPAIAPTANGEQNPTGTVTFYQGLTALGSAPLAASLNNSSVASLPTGKLAGGQASITAVYSGDQFYAAATSNALTVNVQDFSLTPAPTNPPTNLNITKGQAGTAAFVVTALGGFGQQVQLVCSVPTAADMTCSPSPQQLTPTATATFTINTFSSGGPAYSQNREPLWPRTGGGIAFAALVLLLVPRRGRKLLEQRGRRFLVLGLLLAGLCGVGLGCQSVSTPPGMQGTPLGVSTLTITATAYENNVVVSHSVYLTVNVIPAG
ncbi:MAG: Ig-like domain repeat protein [Acidobacteriota bacterium]